MLSREQAIQARASLGRFYAVFLLFAIAPRLFAADPAPVYLSAFEQTGDLKAFPDLGKFLAYAISIRLTQAASLRVMPSETLPCEPVTARPASAQDERSRQAQPPAGTASPISADSLFYTIRGSLETRASRTDSAADVILGIQVLRKQGCSDSNVIWSQTQKFALPATMDQFSSVADKVATILGQDRNPVIRVDVFPAEVHGGGKNGAHAGVLLNRYLIRRLSGLESINPLLVDSSLHGAGQYSVRADVVFSEGKDRHRSVETQVQILSGDKKVSDPLNQRIEVKDFNEDLSDFVFQTASVAVKEFDRIRVVRSIGLDSIPSSDPAALLAKAKAFLCLASSPVTCTPQAANALVALDKIEEKDRNLETWDLMGSAAFQTGDNSRASKAYETALRLPDSALPVRRLPLLKRAADGYYANHDYAKAAQSYAEYIRLARDQKAALPEVWGHITDAYLNWSHSFLLLGNKPEALDRLIEARKELGDRKEIRTEAQSLLASMTEPQVKAAFETLNAALPAPDPITANAAFRLSDIYYLGNSVPQDYALARKWAETAASMGSGEAMVSLAFLYDQGRGVPKDYLAALRWFEKAAATGNLVAIGNLGFIYENGRGVPVNLSLARQWYEKGAAAGDSYAAGSLGYLYERGIGVTPDLQVARQWYEKGAAGGNSFSMTRIGNLYETGKGVPQNDTTARQWYEKAAAAGDGWAAATLGGFYSDGKGGLPRDYSQARVWYERGAAVGDAWAMRRLGYVYEIGGDRAPDFGLARLWYDRASVAGDTWAMSLLGRLYEFGLGVTADFPVARSWYEKAANANDAYGMANLGHLYEGGKGMPVDVAAAALWYRKAADRGDSLGMKSLGDLYAFGRGVTQDDAQALTWYVKSAEAGDTGAMVKAGTYYENGQGVTKDIAKARTWFEKAAAAGDTEAAERLKSLPK